MGSAAVARPQASASASAVWQAQGVSGWLPVGRGPSRAPPAVAPPGSPRARAARTWSARASHALVGLPALAAPSAIRRPREGPRRVGATAVRVASGISPGTLEERDPDMSRVTSVISVLSPPQVPESGRTCGARCPIAAVIRAVRAPAARAGHGGHVGVPPRPAGLACADASGARVAGRPLACATTGPWTCPGAHAGREHPVPRASFLAEPRCLPVAVLASGPAHPAWFPGRHWSHHLCHACLSSHKTERDEQCPHLTGTGIVEVCYRLVI